MGVDAAQSVSMLATISEPVLKSIQKEPWRVNLMENVVAELATSRATTPVLALLSIQRKPESLSFAQEGEDCVQTVIRLDITSGPVLNWIHLQQKQGSLETHAIKRSAVVGFVAV
jgi:hypothetical protein